MAKNRVGWYIKIKDIKINNATKLMGGFKILNLLWEANINY